MRVLSPSHANRELGVSTAAGTLVTAVASADMGGCGPNEVGRFQGDESPWDVLASPGSKSRAARVRWSVDEEAALRAGVARHGEGNWALIWRDAELAPRFMPCRDNKDLKDKWRNIAFLRGPCTAVRTDLVDSSSS